MFKRSMLIGFIILGGSCTAWAHQANQSALTTHRSVAAQTRSEKSVDPIRREWVGHVVWSFLDGAPHVGAAAR